MAENKNIRVPLCICMVLMYYLLCVFAPAYVLKNQGEKCNIKYDYNRMGMVNLARRSGAIDEFPDWTKERDRWLNGSNDTHWEKATVVPINGTVDNIMDNVMIAGNNQIESIDYGSNEMRNSSVEKLDNSTIDSNRNVIANLSQELVLPETHVEEE
ncbi:uncharacterized protein LOC108253576 [Diaphorina citri]|uniref:Uncharacterized protein LOC108253576 n=1 Tax=Diaphorina citri TaxID=121845 RepID=A0A1S4EM89_DIACI|nr:uncharacterized protein LOC108253576 [Diaphorina citri]KAI5701815.1 hypothetical protein M8J75_013637 [Diaphorina citri]KAI5729495.1 hypothetical protein M8J76_003160 [Diaphorina citri]